VRTAGSGGGADAALEAGGEAFASRVEIVSGGAAIGGDGDAGDAGAGVAPDVGGAALEEALGT